jgi:hypothetical protein
MRPVLRCVVLGLVCLGWGCGEPTSNSTDSAAPAAGPGLPGQKNVKPLPADQQKHYRNPARE